MKLNSILKTLSLFVIASPLVYADECEELSEYLKNTEITCLSNTEGKIDELEINDQNLTKDDLEKILSYDSITNFSYIFNIENVHIYENGEVQEKMPDTIDKLTNLKNLKNLQQLNIHYLASDNQCSTYCPILYLGSIEKNILKDLKIKSLQLEGIKMDQDIIREISSLTELESLSINDSPLDNCSDFTPFSNLDKLTYLKIDLNPYGYKDDSSNVVPMELVNTFKSLKELVLINLENQVESLDLPNLEKLTIDLAKQSDDISYLAKLDKLSSLELHVRPDSNISSLEKVNQIKNLTLAYRTKSFGFSMYPNYKMDFKLSEESQIQNLIISAIDISDENVKEIMKLKNLNKLVLGSMYFYGIGDEGKKLLKSLENRCPFELENNNRNNGNFDIKSFKNGPSCNESTITNDKPTTSVVNKTTDVTSTTIAENEPTTTITTTTTTTTEEPTTSTITKTITKVIKPTAIFDDEDNDDSDSDSDEDDNDDNDDSDNDSDDDSDEEEDDIDDEDNDTDDDDSDSDDDDNVEEVNDDSDEKDIDSVEDNNGNVQEVNDGSDEKANNNENENENDSDVEDNN